MPFPSSLKNGALTLKGSFRSSCAMVNGKTLFTPNPQERSVELIYFSLARTTYNVKIFLHLNITQILIYATYK